ncbi:hypothetical protein M405DRAFT_598188 [Rhizopogon salebrosus TDB-379]|nr:hypothetical protein M405DRAFT_598188 [Rhizopogon salebrosus TDB-379]
MCPTLYSLPYIPLSSFRRPSRSKTRNGRLKIRKWRDAGKWSKVVPVMELKQGGVVLRRMLRLSRGTARFCVKGIKFITCDRVAEFRAHQPHPARCVTQQCT